MSEAPVGQPQRLGGVAIVAIQPKEKKRRTIKLSES